MEIAFFVIAVIGLLALSGGGRAGVSFTPAPPQPPPQPWTPFPANLSFAPNQPATGANIGLGQFGSVASTGAQTGAQAAGAASSAIPVIGAAVGALVQIGAALLAAHNQRVQQAKSENAAVNIGVSGWDSDMQQIRVAYNARQLDPQSAITLVKQAMAQFWQLVTPHIQPGRNQCNSGTSCGNPTPGQGVPCSGGYGAACCVGCDDLLPSTNMIINTIQAGGGTVTTMKVYPSSYGVVAREAYQMTWQQ